MYRHLFENSPMSMWLVDNETSQFIDVNQYATRQYGYSYEEFLSMNAADIRPAEEREKFINSFKANDRIGNLGFFKHQKKDGTIFYADVNMNPIIFEGRKCRLVLVSDVTEKILTRNKLKHTTRRLNQAQQIAHLGSWDIDFATGISTWSDEACRIYGIPLEENIQSYESWLSFIHPDDLASVTANIDKGRVSLSSISFNHRIVRRDGTIRYLHSHSEYEKNMEGQPIGLYGIAHDITELKTAEAERTKMLEDIIQRNKDLENFSYMVSHSLRAPVANLLGIINLINNETLSNDEKIFIITESIESVKKLDNTIIDLNYITQAKNPINERQDI